MFKNTAPYSTFNNNHWKTKHTKCLLISSSLGCWIKECLFLIKPCFSCLTVISTWLDTGPACAQLLHQKKYQQVDLSLPMAPHNNTLTPLVNLTYLFMPFPVHQLNTWSSLKTNPFHFHKFDQNNPCQCMINRCHDKLYFFSTIIHFWSNIQTHQCQQNIYPTFHISEWDSKVFFHL